MIKLLVTDGNEIQDITHLAVQVDWGGSYKSASRSLEFELAWYPSDERIPEALTQNGTAVCFMMDNTILFDGYIVNRRLSTNGNTLSIRCYDAGIRLKRNQAIYQFSGITPEDSAIRICNDFNIPIGEIAATGISITQNFVAKSLYDIILAMYTKASEQNEKKYMLTFRGTKLCVIEKKLGNDTLIVRGGANLMNLSVTESIENMVNQVVVYEKDYKTIQTHREEESIKLYGLFQTMIRNGDNAEKKALSTLRDNGIPIQKITVNTLGDTRSVSGSMVMLEEPYTGVWGLFYIDEDSHTWKKGQYYNKLVLNFKNIMDEKEVSDASKSAISTNTGTAGATTPGHLNGIWQYLYA